MEMSERRIGSCVVLAVSGRLDSAVVTQFDRHLSALLERGESNVALDLSSLDFITSRGLSVMLVAAKKLQARQGRIALCGMNDRVRSVFEMCGFLSFFPVFPSAEAACS
jgi:anti-sigma B factor antagonist